MGAGEEAESAGADVIAVTETEESLSCLYPLPLPLPLALPKPCDLMHISIASTMHVIQVDPIDRSIDESFFYYRFA